MAAVNIAGTATLSDVRPTGRVTVAKGDVPPPDGVRAVPVRRVSLTVTVDSIVDGIPYGPVDS